MDPHIYFHLIYESPSKVSFLGGNYLTVKIKRKAHNHSRYKNDIGACMQLKLNI